MATDAAPIDDGFRPCQHGLLPIAGACGVAARLTPDEIRTCLRPGGTPPNGIIGQIASECRQFVQNGERRFSRERIERLRDWLACNGHGELSRLVFDGVSTLIVDWHSWSKTASSTLRDWDYCNRNPTKYGNELGHQLGDDLCEQFDNLTERSLRMQDMLTEAATAVAQSEEKQTAEHFAPARSKYDWRQQFGGMTESTWRRRVADGSIRLDDKNKRLVRVHREDVEAFTPKT